jgi:predicted phosphodiesterase
MKIQVFSDLHFEFGCSFDIPDSESDLVVLAGDIDEGVRGVDWAMNQAARLNKPVLYVFGNHEYYHHAFPVLMTQAKVKRAASKLFLLERNQFVYEETRFLGCTLWTDFAYFGSDLVSECMLHASVTMPDYRMIARSGTEMLRPEDTRWVCEQSLRWLLRELEKPWSGKTVIVTHHSPFYTVAHPYFEEDMLTAAFVSRLDYLIRDYPVDLWIHGHTHYNVDQIMGGTRILTNQAGYPREAIPGNPFMPEGVFEI